MLSKARPKANHKMHPEIFHMGALAIRSYGVMLALSFILGIWYVSRMSRGTELIFSRILILSYIMILGGVIGARLFYVLFHLGEFSGHWLDTINPFQSDCMGIAGLNMYGGIFVGLTMALIYLKLTGQKILWTLDLFAPTIGLGLFFTRIGCFLNGCCFGIPTNCFLSVTFPPGSMPWFIFGDIPIHPAQLYSSLSGLVLFLFLHWKLKNKQFDSEIIAWLLMLEACFRFAIEYVRYYEAAMLVRILGFDMTWNQVMAPIMMAGGVFLYLRRRLKSSIHGDCA